ncbi:HAMP domain-containing sensor histidine kinase [Paenibacillus sp. Marseille-Q4541]|uniref:sensor histidine kinase n=1 Tax=Paenibacillus sp. Marseille-Q4541 TaxID=2831522 RepID=UPI001BA8A943|nr:HAMP domain-containing sensor histidine kinase [Paenibacillus sp. Marseille-Q4541]
MIRSLYVRVVIIFIAVTIISLMISSLFAFRWFEKDVNRGMSSDLMVDGKKIQQLYESWQPEDLSEFLAQSSSMMRSLHITLMDADGHSMDSGNNERTPPVKKESYAEQVDTILSGSDVVIEESGPNGSPARPIAIGMPLRTADGVYAMFLQPNLKPQREDFRRNNGIFNMTSLLVGSFLILMASRFVVSPLKKMTSATRQIARGDFKVNLHTKRRDEIGELAESIQHMAGELGQLEQMRKDFVSNVSHEMQTPLTSIHGFSQALTISELSDEERIRYASIIETESERLSRLIRNLLKLSSLDSDKHPFQPETYRLDRQLKDVILSLEPIWTGKSITFHLHLQEQVIYADRDQLSQVWTNLIHNALKFSPDGGSIEITMNRERGYTVVAIQDQGEGMAKEDLQRIFERFYKADASRNRYEGSGLGLSIAKKIMDIHEGRIQVESELGEGTIFRVYLKL